jgi:hypothetical protein
MWFTVNSTPYAWEWVIKSRKSKNEFERSRVVILRPGNALLENIEKVEWKCGNRSIKRVDSDYRRGAGGKLAGEVVPGIPSMGDSIPI